VFPHFLKQPNHRATVDNSQRIHPVRVFSTLLCRILLPAIPAPSKTTEKKPVVCLTAVCRMPFLAPLQARGAILWPGVVGDCLRRLFGPKTWGSSRDPNS
jgi:hypothetical protein